MTPQTKLLIGFIQKEDTTTLLHRLREERIAVTAIESEGGFLRRKNTTIMLALPDDRVEHVLSLIRSVCRARTERMDMPFTAGDVASVGLPTPTEIPVGGATVLIVDLEKIVKM